MLGSLTQDEFGNAKFLGVPFQILGADTIRMKGTVYGLTPEIYKALSSTSYNGKNMKNETDILVMKNIKNDLKYTKIGDKPSKRKTFFT